MAGVRDIRDGLILDGMAPWPNIGAFKITCTFLEVPFVNLVDYIPKPYSNY